MAVDRDVARHRFAQSVRRVLRRARDRGLTNPKIVEKTGIGSTTFHRWAAGEWGRDWPQLQKVIDFYTGLGEDPEEGFAALGMIDRRAATPPDPQDPDLVVIVRRLRDPNVAEEEKHLIRGQLRYLVDLAERMAADLGER